MTASKRTSAKNSSIVRRREHRRTSDRLICPGTRRYEPADKPQLVIGFPLFHAVSRPSGNDSEKATLDDTLIRQVKHLLSSPGSHDTPASPTQHQALRQSLPAFVVWDPPRAEYSDHAVSGASMIRAGVQALLGDALRRRFDVVLTESLDRLSRDQEDMPVFTSGHSSPASIKIVTLAEGEISELHVGLKGTMAHSTLRTWR
jgi:hypothetical protein